LTTREHALSLLKRFGLEYGKGDEEEEEGKIVLELLAGRREEVYWDGVPDKVRTLAVQRAKQADGIRRGDRNNGDAMKHPDDQNGGEPRPSKKRQKKR